MSSIMSPLCPVSCRLCTGASTTVTTAPPTTRTRTTLSDYPPRHGNGELAETIRRKTSYITSCTKIKRRSIIGITVKLNSVVTITVTATRGKRRDARGCLCTESIAATDDDQMSLFRSHPRLSITPPQRQTWPW